MVGAAIGSRTAPKGCAVLAQPYVLQKQWWGAAMGSRTAPKGGSAPEPPLPILMCPEKSAYQIVKCLMCPADGPERYIHSKN